MPERSLQLMRITVKWQESEAERLVSDESASGSGGGGRHPGAEEKQGRRC